MLLRQLIVLTLTLSGTLFLVHSSTTVPSSSNSLGLQGNVADGKVKRRNRGRKSSLVETTVSVSDHDDHQKDLEEPIVITEEPIHATTFIAECNMPTDLGVFKMRSYVYNSPTQKLEPIAMVFGDVANKENVLVRVHDQCFTSEVFGSLRCDCREQLKESLKMIKDQGGVVIYLQQEGRGIGIANKIAAYGLQDQGMDTVDANSFLGFRDELREYNAVPDVLKDLKIRSIRLMTNNPYKINQLEKLGVKISERIPIQVKPNEFNQKYLRSKKEKMNHFLSEDILGTTTTDGLLISRAGRRLVNQQQHSTVINPEASVHSTEEPKESVPISSSQTRYALGRETVLAAIDAIRDGKLVIVVDDADRENEGDLIMAAEKATPESIGFMVRYTSGVICVSLESERLEYLGLPPMVINNEDPKQTAYTISVDAKHPSVTTGISASDRAITFQKLVDPSATKDDFQRPGHVFPLRYKEGGVISRAGHTEASLDLTRLAGLRPGGVLAEIVRDDGSMMRLPELKIMAKKFGLVLTSVQDIAAYRLEMEQPAAAH